MKLLRVRGLHTPRLCLWLLGWSHRLLRTGCLDHETGRAESAYMTGQVKRFQSAAVLRLSKSEKSAAPLFAEADKLLLRLPYLDAALRGSAPQPGPNAANAELRAANARQKERGKWAAERQSILNRLSDISAEVTAEGIEADRVIDATKDALLSGFAAYAHGLLRAPVTEAQLPEIHALSCMDRLSTLETWRQIQKVCRKEEAA